MKRFLLFLLIAACCFAYAGEKTPAPFSWRDAAKEAASFLIYPGPWYNAQEFFWVNHFFCVIPDRGTTVNLNS